jgi:hypothetical protein
MPFTKIAVATVVLCLTAATVAGADQTGRRGHGRRNQSRAVVRPSGVARRPVVVRRYAVPARVAPHRYGYRYGPRLAHRPVHRPGLGFRIYIGSPFWRSYVASGRPYYARPYPYPHGYYAYGAPYPYPYAYAYPSHPGIYAVPPAGTLYGGVRLEVTPRDAAVYVDGYYAGIVDDFDGSWQRVALEPGAHRFEIVAPGLEPLTFEVNVRANEVIRYRGDMMRAVP